MTFPSDTKNLSDPTDNIGNHRLPREPLKREKDETDVQYSDRVKLDKHSSGHVIHFVHVPTHATCHFKAFLTSWQDQFKQDWKDYTTVGRMDPFKIYSRTSRQINFALDIPSYSLQEAAYNLEQIQTLIQMCYPTFETTKLQNNSSNSSNAGTSAGDPGESKTQSAVAAIGDQQNKGTPLSTISTMVSPPYFRIKFANWLNDPQNDFAMSAIDALTSGLYGTIDTVKFEPDMSENGGFYGAEDLYDRQEQKSQQEKVLIPKLLKLDIVFTVLHTNPLGYDADTLNPRTLSFPYNSTNILQKINNRKIRVK